MGSAGLPDELSRLDHDYNTLIDNVEAGHTTLDEALSVLSAMTVTDGVGAVWAIDQEGRFTRADSPTDTPVEADPAQWAAHGKAHSTMPKISFSRPSDIGEGAISPPTAEPSKAAGRSRLVSGKTDVAGPTSQNPDAGKETFLTPVFDWGKRNMTMVSIIAAGLIAVIVVALLPSGTSDDLSGGEASSTVEAPSPQPDKNTTGQQATTEPPLTNLEPTQPSQATEQTATTPARTSPTAPKTTSEAPSAGVLLPDRDDERRIVGTLTSGDTAEIEKLVTSSPARLDVARCAALWAGMSTVGLSVTTGPAASESPGTAKQTWEIFQGSAKLTSFKVTWVLRNKTWKLAALPTF